MSEQIIRFKFSAHYTLNHDTFTPHPIRSYDWTRFSLLFQNIEIAWCNIVTLNLQPLRFFCLIMLQINIKPQAFKNHTFSILLQKFTNSTTFDYVLTLFCVPNTVARLNFFFLLPGEIASTYVHRHIATCKTYRQHASQYIQTPEIFKGTLAHCIRKTTSNNYTFCG